MNPENPKPPTTTPHGCLRITGPIGPEPKIYGFQIRLVDGLGISITAELMARGVFKVCGRKGLKDPLYVTTLRHVPPPESGGWLASPAPIDADAVRWFIVPEQVGVILLSLDPEHKTHAYANPAKIIRERFEASPSSPQNPW